MAVRVIDHGAKDLVRRLSQRAKDLKVGVVGPGAAALHDGSTETVAEVAARHELGIGVPRRSFIRDFVDEERPMIVGRIRAIAVRCFKGGLSIDQGLSFLGDSLVAAVRTRMAASIPPPLSPRTIEQKGSAATLIETGQLLGSVTWQLDEDAK